LFENELLCATPEFVLVDSCLERIFRVGHHRNDNLSCLDNGVICVSLVHYNKASEVEFLMDTLESMRQWWQTPDWLKASSTSYIDLYIMLTSYSFSPHFVDTTLLMHKSHVSA
jgi:hypothetical protein